MKTKLILLLALLAVSAPAQLFNYPPPGPTTAQFLALSNSVAAIVPNTNIFRLNGTNVVTGTNRFAALTETTVLTNNGAYNGSGVVKADGGFRTVIGGSGIGLGANPSGAYNGIASAGAISLAPASGDGFEILSKTIVAPGTTGNQTIHRVLGRVNVAAAGTSVTVTNQLVTSSSIIIAIPATADATARVTSVVPGSGVFTINTVAVTAETAFSFIVIN